MWKMVLENLIPLLVATVTPVLLLLVNRAMKTIAKKWDLDNLLQYDNKVEDLVVMGIKAVEKMALSKIKSGEPAPAGADKLKAVLDFVNKELAAVGLAQKDADVLRMLVESNLFDGADIAAA